MRGDQHIFLFADAFVRASNPANPAADATEAARRVDMAPKYAQLAFSDSAIVGLFAFICQDDYDEFGTRFLGARHWQELRNRHAEIGSLIVSNQMPGK